MSSLGSVVNTISSETDFSQFTMSRANRLAARDVHIYDLKKPDTVLGGLSLAQDITNSSLYAMLDIFILPAEIPSFQDSFNYFLQTKDGITIARDENLFKPGTYYLNAVASICLSNEVPLVRTISLSSGSRVKAFGDAVRSRDDRCIISGRPVARKNDISFYGGFEAAHVFPLAYEGYWKSQNFNRWIRQEPETGGSINSVQNGLLLDSSVHQLFDTYSLSINPDDKYKVISFHPDADHFAGRTVSQEFINNPLRPPDQLLRWHFRQAVLTNMKGAGEPTFEHDFPPGSDIMGDIRDGPKAAERMEYEVFGRLALHMEIC